MQAAREKAEKQRAIADKAILYPYKKCTRRPLAKPNGLAWTLKDA